MRICILIILAIISTAFTANAQPSRNRFDNRGKDFYIAFLPTDGFDRYPQFMLTVWSEVPTSGRITYTRTGASFQVNIPTARTAYRIRLDTFDLLMPAPEDFGPINSMSVHVEFLDEVTIYGINTQRWSSDAFLATPNDATGSTNVILSYPNTVSVNPYYQQLRRPDFPSQFAIVATQNNTIVNINPTVRITSRPNSDPFTVTLNAGEVFLAQSNGPVGDDLSGSSIQSDKPIIVYGSHQRTNIPFTQNNGRDHIVEQLLPVNLWPSRLYLTPHFQLPKSVPDANIARIIAAFDDTEISIDSVPLRTLQANQLVEIPLDRGKLVTSTKPIQIAQYQHSAVDDRLIRTENDTIGDPFMVVVPSPVQFDTEYVFENYQSNDFFYHYINIIIPTERIKSLLIDGLPVSVAFTRIANTSYSYAQIRMTPGSHTAEARAPFGLIIYGYGPYNSYGYQGGFVFDTLFKDQKPPNLRFADTCNGINGIAIDDSVTDFGLETVRLENSSHNVTLSVNPFAAGADSTRFAIQLIDPYQDGRADITVVDTAGLDHRYSIPIKGFTVSLAPASPILDTLASLNGKQFCTTLTLSNYGAFPQTISSLNFNPNLVGMSTPTQLPLTLAPGERKDLTICYQHTGDTALTIGISVGNGCRDKQLSLLPIISGIDSTRPGIDIQQQPCSPDITLTFTELWALNAGIESINYLRLDNGSAEIAPPGLPSKTAVVQLHRVDPRKDMIYHVRITDLVGNVLDISDTIPGFTLEAQKLNGMQVGLRVDAPFNYNTIKYGREECDSIYLYNYGLFPITLDANMRLLINSEYSIPPEQLPLVLNPGERRGLAVCLRPTGSGERLDTLSIDFFCGTVMELVQLHTQVDPLLGAGSDKCSNALQFYIGGFTKRNFLERPRPNPTTANNSTRVSIGLTREQSVQLALYDIFGRQVTTFINGDHLMNGITEVEMQFGDLPEGTYYLQLRTEDGIPQQQKLILTR